MADISTPTDHLSSVLSDDLLRGVDAIAAFLGESRRRTFYLLRLGHIPGGKVGNRWIDSKRALRAHYERITGASDNTAPQAKNADTKDGYSK